jgi:hypothetical protein
MLSLGDGDADVAEPDAAALLLLELPLPLLHAAVPRTIAPTPTAEPAAMKPRREMVPPGVPPSSVM